MSNFCTTHIFFSKKFQHICVSLDVNFKELLTNDTISFEQLGPVYLENTVVLKISRQIPTKNKIGCTMQKLVFRQVPDHPAHQQSNEGLHCLLKDSLDTTECMNGGERTG